MPIDCEHNFTMPFSMLDKLVKGKPDSIEIKDVVANVRQGFEYPGGVRTPKDYTIPEVHLVLDGKQNVKFKSKALSEYPKRPGGKFIKQGAWTPAIMEYLVTATAMVSRDELKSALMGVDFDLKDGVVKLCGTDGSKLIRITDVPVTTKKAYHAIILPKAIKFLDKFMGDEVLVTASDEHIKLILDGAVTLISRTVNEKYPDYESVFPGGSDGTFRINRTDLLKALKTGDGFAHNITHQITMQLQPNGTVARLSSEDIETDVSWNTDLPVQDHKGVGIEIGYNLRYLETLLKLVSSEYVTFNYSSPVSATIMTGDDERVSLLLMPIRLND